MGSIQVDGLRVLKESSNPRSKSGLAAFEHDPQGKVWHFKRVDDPRVASCEAEELQRARHVTRSVPRIQPIVLKAFLAEQRTLVTENIPSQETLFHHFWNRSRWWDWRGFKAGDVKDLGLRLGTWLRVYHASSATCDEAAVGSLIKSVAQVTLDKVLAIKKTDSRFLKAATNDKLVRYLQALRDCPPNIPDATIAQIHGDFHPINILVGPDGTLFVLDFADTYVGLAWFDVVRLYYAIWAIGEHSVRRANHHLRRCAEALLEQYGEAVDIRKTELFRLFFCFNAVCDILVAAMFGRSFGFNGNRVSCLLAKVACKWLDSANL